MLIPTTEVRKSKAAGVTLLEILIAMLILGLITGGLFSAFVFSRGVATRAEGEMMAQTAIQKMNEQLRQAVGKPTGGFTLNLGIYYYPSTINPATLKPPPPAGATVQFLPVLGASLPSGFEAKYLTSPGDGVYLFVEGREDINGDGIVTVAENDFDGDGQIGFDFDGDGKTDLKRVTIRVQWTPPKGS